ncbi:hypothetical protein [Spirochaeta cellobiosiphila]|uniref:hypothetical protein n=1 Tax=Spirochaeta cellobiosiphila TaxID=504483 RepID=UPI00041E50CE|nr:hypothetical protein [Spirochaeta cellobiosiphila]
MPNDNGSLIILDTKSVRTNASKTLTFLNNTIPKLLSHTVNIVFLGEEHDNEIDKNVATGVLTNPPSIIPGATRAILERGLAYPINGGMTVRQEAMDQGLNRQARSKKLADMIIDAITNHGITLIYIACGSNHGQEIYDSLQKRLTVNWGYIIKPASTD